MKKMCLLVALCFIISACSEKEPDFEKPAESATRSSANINPSQWMMYVDDAASLKQLTLPGTHDSGARYGGIYGECQKMTITQQLDAGVRFLDIRCCLKNGRLKIYHGIMNQYADLDDVLNECISFMSSKVDSEGRMTEGIIMSIKKEDGGDSYDFARAVDVYIDRTSEYWYLWNYVPDMGDIRGKIVLFRRYSNGYKGIDMSRGWSDNATFTIDDVKVQDNYTVSSVSKIANKWSQVKGMLDEAAGNNDSRLYVNFCSGNGVWGTYPKFVAWGGLINKGILVYLDDYLNNNTGKRRYGAVLMDFPSQGIISKLINSNF